MKKILVVGSGGLAREFADFFSDQVHIVGFSSLDSSDHDQYNMVGRLFLNNVKPEEAGTNEAVIAIGSPLTRRKIYEEFKERGFVFPCLSHTSSIVSSSAVLGEGVIVSPKCVVCSNVKIEKCTYLNLLCSIGHEAVLESFVHVNSGSHLGGGCIIGEGTLIGSGSFVRQGVQVGSSSTIAPCSSVLSRVSSNATVLGNPAIRMRVLENK